MKNYSKMLAAAGTVDSTYVAKSIVFDFLTNHGNAYAGIRSIEFKLAGELLDVVITDGSFYTNSSYDSRTVPANAFITSLSKTGDSWSNCWMTNVGEGSTPDRLITVMNNPIVFDEIVVNNYHRSGTFTDRGEKDTVIHISSDAITSTVPYEAISNSTLIFDGELARHVDSNVVDDQILTLI